jgi:zinc D-Ala-D-Ala dipeptidase
VLLLISNEYNRIAAKVGVLCLLLGLTALSQEQSAMAQEPQETVPEYFVELREYIPTIQLELRYFTENNFVGGVIDGYRAEKVFVTREAAAALSKVQSELLDFGLSLKIFDAYRPQQAVDHFVRWAEDLNDRKMKSVFYPDVAKQDLFSDGYISARSGHSRGSTLDLTIVDALSGEELDMGSPWDYFDPISWPSNLDVSVTARSNRNLLSAVMTKHGFRAIRTEWWHFMLENEPFPDTYFDFPIE